jgi:hypothetical protein
MQNYIYTNTGTNAAFISCQPTPSQATSLCTVPNGNTPSTVYVLLNGSQVTVTGPGNGGAFFSAICSTGTTQVWITPGYGQ